MRRRLTAGILLAGVYLLAALVSGRLDIFARRPLLDGVSAPPPYRWVSPPPEFAETNLKPDAVKQNVKFAGGTSEGEFVATDDGQASVVLPKDAVPPKSGATAAAFSIDPRDPARFSGSPKSFAVRGNVYEIRAKYVGGGNGPVGLLDPPGRIILTYPSRTGAFLRSTHMVIQSKDGTTWKVLDTDNDSPQALQIAVSSSELGYFAVVAKPGRPLAPPGGSSPAPFVMISAVVAVAGLAGTYAWRMSRTRAANRKKKMPRQLPKNQRRRHR
jgi:hypothetical protein